MNEQLKLSVSIEVKCIHGNDSSKCEKCSILKDITGSYLDEEENNEMSGDNNGIVSYQSDL